MYDSIDWLDLAYAAKSAQEGSEYLPVPAEVAWTQLEHYEVVIDVARRVDVAVGDDPGATNSLTNGFARAQEHFIHRQRQPPGHSSIGYRHDKEVHQQDAADD